MCPLCIATAAQIVVGATSTGGLTAFVVKKLGTKIGCDQNHQAKIATANIELNDKDMKQ